MHSCFVIRYRFYYQWFFWKLNATETGKTCNKSIRWLFCLLFFFSFFLFLNFNEIPKYDGCNTGMLGLKDPTAVHMKFKDKRFKMSLVRRRSSGKCISKCSNIKGTLNLNYVFFPCRLWLSPFLSVVASRVGVWLVCMGRGGGLCAESAGGWASVWLCVCHWTAGWRWSFRFCLWQVLRSRNDLMVIVSLVLLIAFSITFGVILPHGNAPPCKV